MPSKMKLEVEDQQLADGAVVEEVVQPVVRGFVKDWDAMEDLLNYVLYRNIGWEIGDEGQILFTEPLFTPKVMDLPARNPACQMLCVAGLLMGAARVANCAPNCFRTSKCGSECAELLMD
jgi:actin-related protein